MYHAFLLQAGGSAFPAAAASVPGGGEGGGRQPRVPGPKPARGGGRQE